MNINGVNLPAGAKVDLYWYGVSGNRVSGGGWEQVQNTIGSATVGADGSFTYAYTVPDTHGAGHILEADINGQEVAETTFIIQPSIISLDPTSGETMRLTQGANVQDFSVSADGADLYYSAISQTNKADIYQLSWREDTTRLILACPDANCHAAQISPTGDYLAYERTPINNPDQPDFPQVWLLPLPDGNPILVGDPVHITILPDWSSDGKLAYYDKTIQAFILLNPHSQESRRRCFTEGGLFSRF